jgi:hypothetical protein
MSRKTDIVRHRKMALLSHILAAPFSEASSPLFPLRPVWYNASMTEALQDVFTALRELPDDVQDTIADRLMQLMDLASLHED